MLTADPDPALVTVTVWPVSHGNDVAVVSTGKSSGINSKTGAASMVVATDTANMRPVNGVLRPSSPTLPITRFSVELNSAAAGCLVGAELDPAGVDPHGLLDGNGRLPEELDAAVAGPPGDPSHDRDDAGPDATGPGKRYVAERCAGGGAVGGCREHQLAAGIQLQYPRPLIPGVLPVRGNGPKAGQVSGGGFVEQNRMSSCDGAENVALSGIDRQLRPVVPTGNTACESGSAGAWCRYGQAYIVFC